MKKGSKPAIFIFGVFLLLITTILLIIVGLRFKYEEYVRAKDDLEKQLRSENTKKVNLLADYQMLTSETLIKHYAIAQLNMINSNGPSIILKVEKSEIEIIKNHLVEKYE